MTKMLALGCLLSACATVPAVGPANTFSVALKSVSSDATNALQKPLPYCKPTPTPTRTPVPEPTPTQAPAGKLIGMSGVTDDLYLGWVKTSVGFAKGEVTVDKLQSLGTPGLPYAWRVLKKWPDGSVRIGQIKTVGLFQNKSIQPVVLQWGQTPKPFFTFHKAVKDALDANQFATQLKVEAIVNGTPVSCHPVSGFYKFLVTDASEITTRFRSHCVNMVTNESHPLSMTTYVTVFADDPVVRMSHVLGNDTREFAVGQMNLENVTVVSGLLPRMRWVNEPSYGSKSPILADGQQMAFKTVMTFDPEFNSTAMHVATGEPAGFQFWDDAKASGAFGTAPLPSTRITASTLDAAHNEVDNAANFPAAEARDWLGKINKRPPNTGAQPDFASTMPLELQKAHQGYSARQLAAVSLAVYRESYRPSHFWETRNGVEDQVSSVNYPDLFFWSGRPHYDFSWNTQYPEWFSRASRQSGFVMGDAGGWEGADNQHQGNNHARYLFELSGDHVVGDWLQAYIPVNHWDFFTDWLGHTEAERAFGRATKEAIALTELFPDLPESTLLKERIPQKLQAQKDGVTGYVNLFGHPANNLWSACWPSVGFHCDIETQLGLGPIVVSAWQVGFVQEVWGMVENPDLRYLAAAEDYFLPDGTPKTVFLVNDPKTSLNGGYGVEWWSPWVALAMKYKNAPGAAFVLDKVKPILDARFQHGCGFPSQFFCLNDSWKTW